MKSNKLLKAATKTDMANSEVIGLTKVDRAWLDARPDLKCIGTHTTGLDHIDLIECNKRGIKVISLRDFPEFTKTIYSTAEHTIGLIIALMRNYQRAMGDKDLERNNLTGHLLRGKTLGIIGGKGRIGRQVRELGRSFGMDIIFVDEDDSEVALIDLLENSDVVTLHIPLDNNINFFNEKWIGLMKSTAYLINTSRPGIVDNLALLKALENGKIAGAAVDFIVPELANYPRDNLIMVNHLGGNTFEDRERTKEFITNQVNQYINGTNKNNRTT